jgi:signal transduction histidine kinase
MKVLIAEDSKEILILLNSIVKRMGFETELAEDGMEAWNKLSITDDIRMIITDWEMPNLNGMDLCRKIRAAEFQNYIYIILLTGKTENEDVIDGLDAGADDYIKKPFNHLELSARIRSGMRIIKLQDENKKANMHILKSDNLVSIGNLSEGISHEINTPVQYIDSNTVFMEDAFKAYSEALNQYEHLLKSVKDNSVSISLVESVEKKIDDLDLPYLNVELPQAIKQNLHGLSQISKIVRSMKEFAKPNVKDIIAVDINKAIENTITISTTEWKPYAEIVKNLDSSLPLMNCYPGYLNQVFLNVLLNAAHAIKEKERKNNKKGEITISTKIKKDRCEIKISDTGTGIPEEIQSQIFDPFFTTKEVGEVTGQGLAISNSVITEMHKGSITFETVKNKGTAFVISIPIV